MLYLVTRRVTEPLGSTSFLNLMANAHLVLTDSGGIQEETTILGVSLRQVLRQAQDRLRAGPA